MVITKIIKEIYTEEEIEALKNIDEYCTWDMCVDGSFYSYCGETIKLEDYIERPFLVCPNCKKIVNDDGQQAEQYKLNKDK